MHRTILTILACRHFIISSEESRAEASLLQLLGHAHAAQMEIINVEANSPHYMYDNESDLKEYLM